MSNAILVAPELALPNVQASSAAEVLSALAEKAIAGGWAKESFTAALVAREAEFPTGLPTEIPVALPHTDAEQVLRAGLGLATLATPVDFGEMGGNGEDTVAAQVVILILVEDPSKQVVVLGQLVNLIQRPGWYDALSQCQDSESLAAEFNRLLAL
ncbi:MAG: PTS sugar transporter subunit IIA [Microbacteriaceae bacterium]